MAVSAPFQAQCGYQWCNKLEGMYKDIQISKEYREKFNAGPGVSGFQCSQC